MASTVDITRTRGDTVPFEWTVEDSNGTAVDITGASGKMTVDPRQNPEDDSENLFQLTGVITDATNGVMRFLPTAGNMDLSPGDYYYDFQLTEASGLIRTVAKGTLTIAQDITK